MDSCNSTAQKDRATGEKRPVTELDSRSRSRSFVPNRPDNHRHRGTHFYLRLTDFMQYAIRCWACYQHTAHSTSLKVRVLSGRWIAAHPWPVLKGNWGRRISTGIGSSRGWNSAIERRSQVQAQSLVLFPLLPCPSELWSYNYPWTTPTQSDQRSGSVACVAETLRWV